MSDISSNTKKCPYCAEEIKIEAILCKHCKTPLNNNITIPGTNYSAKSRSMAVFLAIILGGIGAHKFYLNKPGWGLLYFIFCWTFIPAILGILEGICYLSYSDENFQQTYSNISHTATINTQNNKPTEWYKQDLLSGSGCLILILIIVVISICAH